MTISESRIRQDLETLVGPRDPYANMRALNAAADYVASELRNTGLAVTDDTFQSEGEVFRNIVGTHAGTVAPQEQVLIVAHYDTKPGTPGADDNASAVAAMLEIARTLARGRFERTVQFVGFSLEEYEYQGSRHFARQARREGREIVGVLDLEMVGFTSPRQRRPPGVPGRKTGDFIGVVGNKRSRTLVEAFVASARRSVPALPVETLVVRWNGYLLPIVRLSDHAPFWDVRVPAVMITDTAIMRHPHDHKPSDTLDTLDLPFLAQVATATAAAAADLARSVTPASSRLG